MKKRRWRKAFFLMVFLLSGFIYGAVPAKERAALIALYSSTNGDDWYENTNWKGNNNETDGFSAAGSEGSWYGITVSGDHVTKINLESNNLHGTLPPEIGNLIYLKNLELPWNYYLVGSLPPELGNLINLEVLDLGSDGITSIPAEIGNLDNLKTLHLAHTALVSIPSQLGNLDNLEELDLTMINLYIPTVPAELGNLSNLKTLVLARNDLTYIPEELGNLGNLQYLDLGLNQLTSIPAKLGNLSNLKELNVLQNNLESLPSELGNLSNLEILNLSDNKLGTVPAVLGRLSNLKDLDLSFAWISSGIEALASLGNLEKLKLSCNAISGGIQILGNLGSLKELDLSCNRLTHIPKELGNLGRLEILDLSSNWLSASIPPELGNLHQLLELDLSFNDLTSLPPELGNLAHLEILRAPDNRLTVIPVQFGNLTNLRELSLYFNDITGSIPTELANLTNLETLNLYQNNLSGRIPPELGNLSHLNRLNLSGNDLSGSIPGSLGNLHDLSFLYLSRNRLSGSIPSELGNLTGLWELFLYSNKLTGSIPSTFTNLTHLTSNWAEIDINYNGLYSDDEAVQKFLNDTYMSPAWDETQTIAPTDIFAAAVSSSAVKVSWAPIIYTGAAGGYKVFYSTASGGPWQYAGMTDDKGMASYTVTGLDAETTYFFIVRTVTYPHADNKNKIVSEYSEEVSAVTSAVLPEGEQAPFGSMDLPVEGSAPVSGSIAVSGWALDDFNVVSVKIYNISGDKKTYIGDAVFVEGARPDVETAYPGYPNNTRAGWGYMLLTNILPNRGNGVYTLQAIAADASGYETVLGTKTIVCDNANAVKPFGSIDTPASGGTASGNAYINFGWVLTPPPNTIPTDGSTIKVWVDGVPLAGHPVYNNYREDIANLFPLCSNSKGAVGYYYLDTTVYEDGVHTISWSVTDDAGNTNGIGSRYFSILNTGSEGELSLVNGHWSLDNKKLRRVPVDYEDYVDYVNDGHPVHVRKGYNQNREPETFYPDDNGVINIEIKELERVEIQFDEWEEVEADERGKDNLKLSSGYMVVDRQLKPLPIGSVLDTDRGVFFWQPGPGFIGEYRFVFIKKEQYSQFEKKRLNVIIKTNL